MLSRFLLALLGVTCAGVAVASDSREHDLVLCRSCGADVADGSYLLDKRSPSAHRTERQTLFGHRNLTVQTLVNPFGVRFDIITIAKARCGNIGPKQSAESWFPGYSWQICTCPQCRQHLGWTFHADRSEEPAEPTTFHGIILDNVLEENFTNSLLMMPKMYRM